MIQYANMPNKIVALCLTAVMSRKKYKSSLNFYNMFIFFFNTFFFKK